MKRFWTDVTVTPADGGWALALDGRRVNTPGRQPLIVPTAALAQAIAGEWRAVAETIDPRAMPLTGLANAAIERVAPDPHSFARGLAAYAESDLLCYRAEGPAALVTRQSDAWDPLLEWARARYDIHFAVTAGIVHVAQPPATIARLAEAICARDAFALAGLSPVVTITGSLVAALALSEGAASAETVWQAAQIDEAWQAEQWGEDALALRARDARRREYDAAVRFLSLLADQRSGD